MTLKKVSAIFVSAALAMAMLVGCGSGSVGDQLRDKTGAGAKAEVNRVAIELADVVAEGKDYVDYAFVDAVKNVAESGTIVAHDDKYPTAGSYYSSKLDKVIYADGDGYLIGWYYAIPVANTDEDALVAEASAEFDKLKAEIDGQYSGAEYYIGASAIDEDAGSYMVVIYADMTEATEK